MNTETAKPPAHGSPTVVEFRVAIKVMAWLRDQMAEANPSWVEPIVELNRALFGCLKIAVNAKAKSHNEPQR